MAVARMKRVAVLFPRERRAEALALLQGAGVVQLETPEEVRLEDQPGPGAEQAMAERLGHALDYLDRFAPEKKGLLGSFVTLKAGVTEAEVEAFRRRLNAEEVCGGVGADDRRWGQITARLGELDQEVVLLESWRGLGLRLGDLDDTPLSHIHAYTVTAAGWEAIGRELGEAPVYLWEAPGAGRQVHFVAAWPRSVAGVGDTLAGYGARRVAFGRFREEPEAELEALGAERRALEEEREELRRRALSLEGLRPGLKALHDYYQAVAERDGLVLGRTEKVALATGWVAAGKVPPLREALEQLDPVAVVVEDPRPEDRPPVILDNPRWLKPFEVVTTLYSYPRYNEVDPTPLLAPFFFVFFGMALGDAGYGLVLTALAWFLIRKLGLRPGEDNLPRLLMIGGVAAVVFGTIGGSWFGDSLHLLPAWGPVVFARDVLTRLDPVTDPLTTLMIALGLGVLQVWTGIAIKLGLEIRAGRVADALWEQGTWLLFIPSLLVMGVAGEAVPVGPQLAMVTGLGVALGAARQQKNWLLKPFSGLLGLYGVMGYLGDVLSYARLLALGLASTIIGIVVNQIAALVGGIPLVGVVAGAVVMAGGHLFNLLISTLGSFVHAGRLQFVEFFTKFFEGGGKPFKPFRREGRFTVVRG